MLSRGSPLGEQGDTWEWVTQGLWSRRLKARLGDGGWSQNCDFRMAGGNLGYSHHHPTKDSVVKGVCGIGAEPDQPQRGANSPGLRGFHWNTDRSAPVGDLAFR